MGYCIYTFVQHTIQVIYNDHVIIQKHSLGRRVQDWWLPCSGLRRNVAESEGNVDRSIYSPRNKGLDPQIVLQTDDLRVGYGWNC